MISIIIPVYNSQKYLATCVVSILAQTYSDLEILLIDDGSKDSSPAICDELAQLDARVRVLHKPNGGISSARNAGLDMARGEWVTFCDNDDRVSPQWLERLLALADEETLPMCAFTRVLGELGSQDPMFLDSRFRIREGSKVQKDEYLEYYKQRVGGFVWNALFRRDIIEQHHLRFPERKAQGDINEDLIFDLQYLPYVKKIAYTGYADYYWASNESNHSKETAQKFYFEKYGEKYRLWRDYIHNYVSVELQKAQIKELATFHLFELLQSILTAPTFSTMKQRVCHPTIQECIRMAEVPVSDRKVVWLIKHKLTIILWYLFKH